MKRNSVLYLVLLLATPALASTDPIAENVKFFTPKLNEAYKDFASFETIGNACESQFGERCPEGIKKTYPDILYLKHVKQSITIFNDESLVDVSKIINISDLKLLWLKQQGLFLEHSFEYETELESQLSAVGKLCPRNQGDDRDNASIIGTIDKLNLKGFWSLSEEKISTVRSDINRRSEFYLKTAHFDSNEQCTETRQFGAKIIASLKSKLKPYLNSRALIVEPEAITPQQKMRDEVAFVIKVVAYMQIESDKALGKSSANLLEEVPN